LLYYHSGTINSKIIDVKTVFHFLLAERLVAIGHSVVAGGG
jgi:hypothetical protein